MPSKGSVALISCTTDAWCGWGTFTCEISQRLAREYDATLHLLQRSAPRIAINGAQLLHCLTDWPSCVLSAGALAQRARIPLVISTHGTYAVTPLAGWMHGWRLRRTYRGAAHLTAPSRFTADRLRARIGTEVPLTVVSNGVAVERFAQTPDLSDLRARYGPGPILLTVGALKPRKGQDVVLRAFAQLKHEFPRAVYLLVGEDQWGGRLQRLAAAWRIPDVHCLGVVRHEEVVRYYHLCDAFALTPRMVDGAFEGFGIVYLEAGAAAKPVIGTRSGGVPEAVRDGETGLLVPEDGLEALVNALRRVLGDRAFAHQLGSAGFRHAQAHSWDHYVTQLTHLYEEVLA